MFDDREKTWVSRGSSRRLRVRRASRSVELSGWAWELALCFDVPGPLRTAVNPSWTPELDGRTSFSVLGVGGSIFKRAAGQVSIDGWSWVSWSQIKKGGIRSMNPYTQKM